jgi:hypothetical protein
MSQRGVGGLGKELEDAFHGLVLLAFKFRIEFGELLISGSKGGGVDGCHGQLEVD